MIARVCGLLEGSTEGDSREQGNGEVSFVGVSGPVVEHGELVSASLAGWCNESLKWLVDEGVVCNGDQE